MKTLYLVFRLVRWQTESKEGVNPYLVDFSRYYVGNTSFYKKYKKQYPFFTRMCKRTKNNRILVTEKMDINQYLAQNINLWYYN